MKKFIFKTMCLVLMGISCAAIAQAETRNSEKPEAEVTKYTVMERFEPQLVLSAEERLQLKDEYVVEIKRRREILDTLDISERRREKLIRDLLKHPYSPRLSRTLAKIEFEDENE